MEHEILNTLQDIRGTLIVLTSIVSIVMLVWVLNWISNIVKNFSSAWENSFINTANKHFERAEFEKLAQHCQEKLNKYPNNLNAIWWLARAKLEIGKASEAKALFERLLELEPSWRESHIEPYINKLPNE